MYSAVMCVWCVCVQGLTVVCHHIPQCSRGEWQRANGRVCEDGLQQEFHEAKLAQRSLNVGCQRE